MDTNNLALVGDGPTKNSVAVLLLNGHIRALDHIIVGNITLVTLDGQFMVLISATVDNQNGLIIVLLPALSLDTKVMMTVAVLQPTR